jgi:hypothetical protein
MSPTITAEQRDALYDQILDRLSGIDAVWVAVEQEDYDTADRLGREYSDDLRLILDDLGWGDELGRSVELTAPADVLRRVFSRLGKAAEELDTYQKQQWTETQEAAKRNELVVEACRQVLGDLGDSELNPQPTRGSRR